MKRGSTALLFSVVLMDMVGFGFVIPLLGAGQPEITESPAVQE